MAWLYKQLGRRRGARNHETARSGLAWIDRQPEVQRAPSRLERESARCESRHRPRRVRVRRSPTPAAGYLGLRPGGNRPLGIVVPRSLGTLQRFPFCALIRAGRKRKRGMGIVVALRRLNYNSQQAVQGAVGRPVIPALPSLSLEARPLAEALVEPATDP